MKWCTKCQSEYEDSQEYCMGCGGPLVDKETAENSGSKGVKCPICGCAQTSQAPNFCQECKFALYAYYGTDDYEERERMVEKFLEDSPKRRTRYEQYREECGKALQAEQRRLDEEERSRRERVARREAEERARIEQETKADRVMLLNAVEVKKIKWPQFSGRFEDINFELPRYAKAVYIVAQVVEWVVAIGCGIASIVAMFNVNFILGLLCLVATAIGLALALYAARIVFELTILFYEQLKTMRQIRDLIAAKLS